MIMEDNIRDGACAASIAVSWAYKYTTLCQWWYIIQAYAMCEKKELIKSLGCGWCLFFFSRCVSLLSAGQLKHP